MQRVALLFGGCVLTTKQTRCQDCAPRQGFWHLLTRRMLNLGQILSGYPVGFTQLRTLSNAHVRAGDVHSITLDQSHLGLRKTLVDKSSVPYLKHQQRP